MWFDGGTDEYLRIYVSEVIDRLHKSIEIESINIK